jgi:hypothetical protein
MHPLRAILLSLFLAAVAVIQTACVSITDPVPMGKDTYMIALSAHGGLSSNAELLAATIKKASEFCAAQGLNVEVTNTGATGVQGWTPQENQVVFRCLAPSDKGYSRPTFKPTPNIIIENRND